MPCNLPPRYSWSGILNIDDFHATSLRVVNCTVHEHAEDVGLHGQALDVPFTAVGASECNALFRQVLSRNVDVKHLRGTMREQIEGAPCIYHRKLGGCPLQACDLAVFGTPCPPFSEMRVGRYKPGTVANHPLAQVTFRDAHNHPGNALVESPNNETHKQVY